MFFYKEVWNKTAMFYYFELLEGCALEDNCTAFRWSRLSRERPCGLTYRAAERDSKRADLQMFSRSSNIHAEMSLGRCKILAWGMSMVLNWVWKLWGTQTRCSHPSALFRHCMLMIRDITALQSFAIQTPVHFLLLFMWHWRQFLWRYLSSWWECSLTTYCQLNGKNDCCGNDGGFSFPSHILFISVLILHCD